MSQLETLLVAGVTDGRAGDKGQKLLEKLEDLRGAVVEEDQSKIREKLREIWQTVREGLREGKIEPDFAQQAFAAVDRVAVTNGVVLSDE